MKEKLIELFTENFKKPLDVDEIYELLNLSTPEDFTLLAKCLNELEDEYFIIHNSKGKFATLKYFNLAVGVLDVKDGGFGFVDTKDEGIFVPKMGLNNAITYDTVLIKVRLDNSGRKEGVVERIIKRGNTHFYGQITKRYNKKLVFIPIDSKIKGDFYIEYANAKAATIGDVVKTKVLRYHKDNSIELEVEEIMGDSYKHGLDISMMVASAKVPVEFSSEALEELDDIPDEIDINDYPNRVDLTNKLIITIDGDDAKDLDDAIHVEKLPNGNYQLGVYIADVSNYVKESTFLDLDAFNRATSIYLPDRVIPMLPRKLSNGICSLNENVYRLVMACEMEFDSKGILVEHQIFEGIIKTRHRMTYNNVNKMLEGDIDKIKEYEDIYKMVLEAADLAEILNYNRIDRGAFEFETPEPKLILDEEGSVLDIILRERGIAECMIEEFMLAANECVAESMTWLDVPFIYRVHEEPKEEKLSRLISMLNYLGGDYHINNKKSTAKVLQKILKDYSLDEQGISIDERTRRSVINKMIVKSMAKACYQEENIGHFGLQSKCYCHFTSPIRRYPDLLVHRLIKEFMLNETFIDSNDKVGFYNNKVHEAGIISSKNERISEKLERDAIDYKKCEYISRFRGKVFSGTISQLTNYGMYISLDNTVTGLVRYYDMRDDYYIYNELEGVLFGRNNHIEYKLGDRVRIKVGPCYLDSREIIFDILGKEKKNGKGK